MVAPFREDLRVSLKFGDVARRTQ